MDFSFYRDPLIRTIFERAYYTISDMNGWKAVYRLNKVSMIDDPEIFKIFKKVNKIINEVSKDNSRITVSVGYIMSTIHFIITNPHGLQYIREAELNK